MAGRKLDRLCREFVKDQLVDEALEDGMAAVAQREDIAGLPWSKDRRKEMPHWLHTPYGTLEVWPGIGFTVKRDGKPLVHARSPLDAVFTGVPAAKAAGLVHIADGFGNKSPYKDGLWWNTSRPAAEHPLLPALGDFTADPSIPDDHEWGRHRLDRLLKDAGATADSADDNLLIDLNRVARSWQLPPPTWTKRAHGCLELNTPYGILVVRRLIGWVVERNGAPLVWYNGGPVAGKKVIFDKLEHAKVSALAHAGDFGELRFRDGTRWDEQLARNVDR